MPTNFGAGECPINVSYRSLPDIPGKRLWLLLCACTAPAMTTDRPTATTTADHPDCLLLPVLASPSTVVSTTAFMLDLLRIQGLPTLPARFVEIEVLRSRSFHWNPGCRTPSCSCGLSDQVKGLHACSPRWERSTWASSLVIPTCYPGSITDDHFHSWTPGPRTWSNQVSSHPGLLSAQVKGLDDALRASEQLAIFPRLVVYLFIIT